MIQQREKFTYCGVNEDEMTREELADALYLEGKKNAELNAEIYKIRMQSFNDYVKNRTRNQTKPTNDLFKK